MNPTVPSVPQRHLLIKITGILIALSPLCTWFFRYSLLATAVLAPLLLFIAFAAVVRVCQKNVTETFRPIYPAVRLTIMTGIAFTAVTMLSTLCFIWIPHLLASMSILPTTWLINLGFVNTLIVLGFFVLLGLVALYAIKLCLQAKP